MFSSAWLNFCLLGRIHNTQEKSEKATITDHFGFVFEEKSRDYCDVIGFEKHIFKIFSVHMKTKAGVFKSVFEKLHFRERIEWVVGLNIEVKLRFQISPVLFGWDFWL